MKQHLTFGSEANFSSKALFFFCIPPFGIYAVLRLSYGSGKMKTSNENDDRNYLDKVTFLLF